MNEFTNAITTAAKLILQLDSGLTEIIYLSLQVSITAVIISALIGLPLGASLALAQFRGKNIIIIL